MDITNFDDDNTDKKLCDNHLLNKLSGILSCITDYKKRVRQFYFEVVLSSFSCPACGGQLHMIGNSECSCSCGNAFDPTLAFQKSACCGAGLIRKTFHYACSKCRKSNPSRFIFDERVFDKAYFREMMRESRERKKKKREEIRKLLAQSRSDTLSLTEFPDIEIIPGLIEDLNEFIQKTSYEAPHYSFGAENEFDLNKYRDHILSVLSWDSVLFSEMEPLIDDIRDDKIYRFITLVIMDHDREVDLNQLGDDLSVQRRYNEAYA
jgi:hypothetical protein